MPEDGPAQAIAEARSIAKGCFEIAASLVDKEVTEVGSLRIARGLSAEGQGVVRDVDLRAPGPPCQHFDGTTVIVACREVLFLIDACWVGPQFRFDDAATLEEFTPIEGGKEA